MRFRNHPISAGVNERYRHKAVSASQSQAPASATGASILAGNESAYLYFSRTFTSPKQGTLPKHHILNHAGNCWVFASPISSSPLALCYLLTSGDGVAHRVQIFFA